MSKMILDRLREPSSWSSIAVLLGIGSTAGQETLMLIGSAIAGVLGICIRERGK